MMYKQMDEAMVRKFGEGHNRVEEWRIAYDVWCQSSHWMDTCWLYKMWLFYMYPDYFMK